MRLIFIDVETTSLRPDRRAWEIGLIIPGRTQATTHRAEVEPGVYHCFVDVADLDLGNADPASLRVGRFHERHPQLSHGRQFTPEAEVLRQVEAITRDAVLVGSGVHFDAETLDRRMRANGILPSWHHRLVEVKSMAAGYIHGHNAATQQWCSMGDPGAYVPEPPFDPDALSSALGIAPMPEEERHTALGDARWALRLYEVMTHTADPTADPAAPETSSV